MNTEWKDPFDPVLAPGHYCYGGIEVKDVINAKGLHRYHWRASAVEYILRAHLKHPNDPELEVEDLDKAITDLLFEIERLGGESKHFPKEKKQEHFRGEDY